jgi:hypothetical protein
MLDSPLGAHVGDYHTTRVNAHFGGNLNADAGSTMKCRYCDQPLDRDRIEPGASFGICVNRPCPAYGQHLKIYSDGSRSRI